jgi:HSP20 family protein
MERFPKIFMVNLGAGEEEQKGCYDLSGQHRLMGRKGWNPCTDILETEEAVVIILNLAGLGKEAIRVECQGDILKVSGVRTRSQVPGIKRFHRMEIDYGPFERCFRVPPGLDLDRIGAVHRDGFLELTLPKKEAQEPVRIVIVHEETY